MRKLLTMISVIAAMLLSVGVVSAHHYDYGEDNQVCKYTLTWNSGDYNIEININEDEVGYYFEMDSDHRVTALSSDQYLVHFNENNAGEKHTFYAQAHSPDGEFCEVHGVFRVKYNSSDLF